MNEEKTVLDVIIASLPFGVIAVVGGLIRYFRFGFPPLGKFVSGLAVAYFSGFVCYTFFINYIDSIEIIVGLVAMAGHCGGVFLDMILEHFLKKKVNHEDTLS